MNIYFLAPIVALFGLLSRTYATDVGFSPVPNARTVVNNVGGTVPDGSLVIEGTFASEAFSINTGISFAANVSAIMSTGGWKQFGLDTTSLVPDAGVSSNLGIFSGKLGGSVTDNNSGPSKADFFNTKPVYAWIFNAPTIGAATQMGIFRATTAGTPWVFPTYANGVGDTATLSTTATAAPVIAAIGGVGSSSSSLLTLTAVTPVPEPTTSIFGAMAVFGILCKRFRFRS